MTSLGNDLIQSMTGRYDYEFIPMSVALEGKFNGAFCMTKRYWLTVQDHLVIYIGKKKDSYSPQCNMNELVLKSWLSQEKYFEGFDLKPEFLEYAYVDGHKYWDVRINDE